MKNGGWEGKRRCWPLGTTWLLHISVLTATVVTCKTPAHEWTNPSIDQRRGSQNPSEGALGHLVATKGGRTVFLLGDVVTDRLPTLQWMAPYCAQMHSTSWAHVVVNNKDKYDVNEDMRLGERWGSEFWDIEGINGGGVNVIKIHCIQV